MVDGVNKRFLRSDKRKRHVVKQIHDITEIKIIIVPDYYYRHFQYS